MTTENHRPDDREDDALHAAWRASSREAPPPALDAAILAAAHRAVGSVPRKAGAEALRPPKWWLPFAAAAVVGVVAVGVVQLAPHDPAIDVSSGEGARPPAAGMTAMAPQAPASSAAKSPSTEDARPAVSGQSAAPAQSSQSAAPAQPVPPATPQLAAGSAKPDTPSPRVTVVEEANRVQQRAPMPGAPEREATQPSAPAPSTAPARSIAPQEAAPKIAAKPAPAPAPFPAPSALREQRQAEPAPFPAAPPETKLESKDARKDLAAQDRATDAVGGFARDEAQGRVAGAPPAQPVPPPPPAAAPSPAATPSFAPPPGSGPPPTPQVRPAPAPTAPMAARTSESAPSLDRSRETSTGNLAQLSKQRSNAVRAEAIELAKDPDAWIVRIRKLRDGGRVDEAAAELREFDALVPNAQQRMPAELRRFMERQSAK